MADDPVGRQDERRGGGYSQAAMGMRQKVSAWHGSQGLIEAGPSEQGGILVPVITLAKTPMGGTKRVSSIVNQNQYGTRECGMSSWRKHSFRRK